MVIVLIGGSPGVGKSSISFNVAESLNLKHIEVSKLIKAKSLYLFNDDKRDCTIYDEDKVIEEIGVVDDVIVDFIDVDIFDYLNVDLIFIIRCDSDILYKRLEDRNYKESKIQENVEAEIFRVCLDQALETYDEYKIIELINNTRLDFDKNIKNIINQIKKITSQ